MLYIKANSVVSSALESAFTSSVSATVEDTHDYSYLDAVQACHESALEAQMAMYDMVHFDVEMSTKSVEAYTEAGGNTELLESYMRPVYEGFFESLWNSVKSFFQKIYKAIVSAFKSTWNFLKGLYNKAKTKLQEWFKKKEADEKKAESGSSSTTTAAASSTSSSDTAASTSAPASTSSAPAASSSSGSGPAPAAAASNKVVKPSVINRFADAAVTLANSFLDKFKASVSIMHHKQRPLELYMMLPQFYRANDFITSPEDSPEIKCKEASEMIKIIKSSEANMYEITEATLADYLDQYSKAKEIDKLGETISRLEKAGEEYKTFADVTEKFNEPKETKENINYNLKLLGSFSKVILTACAAVRDIAGEATGAMLKACAKDSGYYKGVRKARQVYLKQKAGK